MFRHPVIWIQLLNGIESTWVSTADCVWEGPQWLKSKQCLKLEVYLEFEHLFKVSLRVSDASQTDVLNDLLMLKSYSEDKNTLRSQSTAYTKPNVGTTGAQSQVNSVEEAFSTTGNGFDFKEAYKELSFEVRGSCY